MSFEEMLSQIVAFVGQDIYVAVSASGLVPLLIIETTGVLSRGDALGTLEGGREAYLLTIGNATLLVDRRSFSGASWDGTELQFGLGVARLRIGQTPESRSCT